MAARGEEDRNWRPATHGELASPFLEEELFAEESDSEWEAHLSMLEAETPFRHAFTKGLAIKGAQHEDEHRRLADESSSSELAHAAEAADEGAYAFEDEDEYPLEEETHGEWSEGDDAEREDWLIEDEDEPEDWLYEGLWDGGEEEFPHAEHEHVSYHDDLMAYEEEALATVDDWTASVEEEALESLLAITDADSTERFAPEVRIPYAATDEEVKSVSELRTQIVAVAKREWMNWGKGTLDETGPRTQKHLLKYWMEFLPRNRFSRQKAENWIEARHAWSAAFVSYVMQEAGAGGTFEYGSFHTIFVAAAKKATLAGDASKFQAQSITTVKPEVGDLVCRDRTVRSGGPCANTNWNNLAPRKISHSDIVVEVHPDHIVILGGNTAQTHPHRGKTSDTVGQRKVMLDKRGFVIPVQKKGACPYFAIVKPPGSGVAVSTGFDGTAPIPEPGSVSGARPSAERVRFAQRVLNAAEGESLKPDAALGPLTRGALERFRRKHGLGTGGVLDEKTGIALVQRALEELAQQSLFPIGVRDAATDQAVAGFKAERRLGSGASLDDATRLALADALDQRRGPAADTGAAPHRPTVGAGGAVHAAGVAIKGGSWGGWVGRQTQGTEPAKISRNQIRDKYGIAVAVAAQVETGGYYDKVQMYDRGILSWGIKQWTLHRGSLQQLLGFIKARLEPSLWARLFPGIDIQGTTLLVNGKSLQVPREDDDAAGLALRRSFRGSEDPKKFNTSIMDNWLSVFALAARNPSVQQLQLEYAAKSLRDNLNKHLGRTLKARNDVKQTDVQNYGRVGDYIEESPLALALFNSMETQNPKWTYIYLKRVVDRLAGRHRGHDVARWPSGWQEMFAQELSKELGESGFACWGTKAVATKPACKARASRTEKTLQAYRQLSG
jgi:peptidoglycan hydrolase-like protein with peptidoglycan-binding domain